MAMKTDISDGKLVEGWLRDVGCAPEAYVTPQMNWGFKAAFPPSGPSSLNLTISNPAHIPRAVFIGCHITPAAQHVEAFNRLEEDARKEFWQHLRNTLNRDFVEFQIEGNATSECPKAFQVLAMRFDDGLTLDSFARSLSSVLKGCIDGVSCFQDRLGDAVPAASEFAFKRLGPQ
jgi:hypothetical protein